MNPYTSWVAFLVLLVSGLGGAFVLVHLLPLWLRRPGSDEEKAA